MKNLTCRNPACTDNGIPHPFDWAGAVQAAKDAGAVLQTPWCGACSTQYTDITDAPAS